MDCIKKVDSLESFLEQLPKLNEKVKNSIFYRGQCDVEYKLGPSVFRIEGQNCESDIYNEIITECAEEFVDLALHNEILSKMQHYGVPTRLYKQ